MDIRNQYAYLRPQQQVWWFILISLGIHMGLVLVLIIGGWIKEHQANSYQRGKITALLRKGKPRPEDWLPRKPAEPAPALPTNVRSDQTSKATASNRRRDYSTDMKKAMARLDQEVEGSPEGVEEGDSLIAQKGNEYVTKIYKAIKNQYSVPEIISPRERLFLTAVVVIWIDPRGNIRQLKFEKRSDNPVFNSAVEAAIRKAAPFPSPPPELADRYAAEGIGIEFDAKKL